MLTSIEHEIIHKHDKYIWEFESKKRLYVFMHFSFYEQLYFTAQLIWAWKKFLSCYCY